MRPPIRVLFDNVRKKLYFKFMFSFSRLQKEYRYVAKSISFYRSIIFLKYMFRLIEPSLTSAKAPIF